MELVLYDQHDDSTDIAGLGLVDYDQANTSATNSSQYDRNSNPAGTEGQFDFFALDPVLQYDDSGIVPHQQHGLIDTAQSVSMSASAALSSSSFATAFPSITFPPHHHAGDNFAALSLFMPGPIANLDRGSISAELSQYTESNYIQDLQNQFGQDLPSEVTTSGVDPVLDNGSTGFQMDTDEYSDDLNMLLQESLEVTAGGDDSNVSPEQVDFATPELPTRTSTPRTIVSVLGTDDVLSNLLKVQPPDEILNLLNQYAHCYGLKLVRKEAPGAQSLYRKRGSNSVETEEGASKPQKKRKTKSSIDQWWSRLTKLTHKDLQLNDGELACIDKGDTILDIKLDTQFASLIATSGSPQERFENAMQYIQAVESGSFQVDIVQVILRIMVFIACHDVPSQWHTGQAMQTRILRTAKTALGKFCEGGIGNKEWDLYRRCRSEGGWYVWFAERVGLGGLVHLLKYIRPKNLWGRSGGREASNISETALQHLVNIGVHHVADISGADKLMHHLLWKVCGTFIANFPEPKDDADPFLGFVFLGAETTTNTTNEDDEAYTDAGSRSVRAVV